MWKELGFTNTLSLILYCAKATKKNSCWDDRSTPKNGGQIL